MCRCVVCSVKFQNPPLACSVDFHRGKQKLFLNSLLYLPAVCHTVLIPLLSFMLRQRQQSAMSVWKSPSNASSTALACVGGREGRYPDWETTTPATQPGWMDFWFVIQSEGPNQQQMVDGCMTASGWSSLPHIVGSSRLSLHVKDLSSGPASYINRNARCLQSKTQVFEFFGDFIQLNTFICIFLVYFLQIEI